MTGNTGYTAPTNASSANFAVDLTGVYEHFDPLIGESEADSASLPATGNWVGRTILDEDNDDLWVCTALPGSWTRVTRSSEATSSATMSSGWNTTSNILQTRSGLVFWSYNGMRTSTISAGGTVATIPAGFQNDTIYWWQVLDYTTSSNTPTSSRTLEYVPSTNTVKILQSLPANSWLAFTIVWRQVS